MNNPFEEIEEPKPRRSLLGGLRASFLTGLVVILPIWLTAYVVWTVAGWFDAWVLPFVPMAYHPENLLRDVFGDSVTLNVRGVGVIVFLLFTILVGWLAKGLIGRSIIRWAESYVARLPVVRSIYNGLKQIAETVFAQTETSFDRACLVEYPRAGLWAVAFISTSAKGEINERVPVDEQVMAVFVPTTPNPTSGFMLFVPKSEIVELDMSVEDAAKLVISGGLVYPNGKPDAKALKGRSART